MNQILDQIAKQPLAIKAAVLVVIVGIIGFMEFQLRYKPLMDRLAQLHKQKDELQVKLLEHQAVADNLPLFQEEVNVLNEQLKQAVSLLPNEADIHSILRQLSILARKTNVNLDYFKPGQTTSRGFYSEIGMDLKLSGTYHDIASYIDQIGKLSRIINVYDFTVSNISKQGRAMKVSIDCRAATFMFKGGA